MLLEDPPLPPLLPAKEVVGTGTLVVIVTPLVTMTVETEMLVVTVVVVLPVEETREAVEWTERDDCTDNTESEESDATDATDCEFTDAVSVEDVVVDPGLVVEESTAGEEVEVLVLDGESEVVVVLTGVVSDEA